jgi:prophage antirepressor-like protein
MDIIKAFQTNNVGVNITIQGTYEEPLMRASDIASVLGLVNVHTTIKDFDNTEKVIHSLETLGGKQDVTFLTEKGLYQILFTSRKPIAKTFKNWVCEVIKEIRLRGKYDLEEQLLLKDEQILSIKEKTMLDDFHKKRVVYLGFSEENVIKFGFSDDIKVRVCTHKREIGPQFSLQYIIETTFNRELENLIKQKLKEKIFTKKYDGREKPQTELIQLDKDLTLAKLHKQVLEMLEEFNSKDALVKAYEEIERLKEKYEKKEEPKPKEKKPKVPEEPANRQITDLKKTVAILQGVNQFKAKNIITGEIREFNSFEAAREIAKIGPASMKKGYLDKPKQCRGWIFHSSDKPCWVPPKNFIFNPETKASTHMLFCKSVHRETKEETYYNSVVECAEYISKLDVDFENTETNRRTINRLISTDKPTLHPYLARFEWSLVPEETCGTFV